MPGYVVNILEETLKQSLAALRLAARPSCANDGWKMLFTKANMQVLFIYLLGCAHCALWHRLYFVWSFAFPPVSAVKNACFVSLYPASSASGVHKARGRFLHVVIGAIRLQCASRLLLRSHQVCVCAAGFSCCCGQSAVGLAFARFLRRFRPFAFWPSISVHKFSGIFWN